MTGNLPKILSGSLGDKVSGCLPAVARASFLTSVSCLGRWARTGSSGLGLSAITLACRRIRKPDRQSSAQTLSHKGCRRPLLPERPVSAFLKRVPSSPPSPEARKGQEFRVTAESLFIHQTLSPCCVPARCSDQRFAFHSAMRPCLVPGKRLRFPSWSAVSMLWVSHV